MTPPPSVKHLDILAIGAGPANLSLAALGAAVPGLRLAVLEARRSFTWHGGLQPAHADIQVSPLKDLVSLVDPTSRYSFLNFLAEHGRIHRALIAHRWRVSRAEFEQYYAWVARSLDSVSFGHSVSTVDHDGEHFHVRSNGEHYIARTVVCGVGRAPRPLPTIRGPGQSTSIVHASEYSKLPGQRGRDVLVVGGGQSGAEIFYDLLVSHAAPPRSVTWVNSRSNFRTLEDSPFANEVYNPRFTENFYGHAPHVRQSLLKADEYTSDGISADLLVRIYDALYSNDYVEGNRISHRMLASTRLEQLEVTDRVRATLRDTRTDRSSTSEFDTAILATGYRFEFPSFLNKWYQKIRMEDGEPALERDFSASVDGVPDRTLFFQNASRNRHGLADSNLAIVPWRSATILNSATGVDWFRTDLGDITVSLS